MHKYLQMLSLSLQYYTVVVENILVCASLILFPCEEYPDSSTCFRRLVTLITYYRCWSGDPNERMSFDEIVTQLREVNVSLTIGDPVGRDWWREHFDDAQKVHT
mgnify:CR=1 FL=1